MEDKIKTLIQHYEIKIIFKKKLFTYTRILKSFKAHIEEWIRLDDTAQDSFLHRIESILMLKFYS